MDLNGQVQVISGQSQTPAPDKVESSSEPKPGGEESQDFAPLFEDQLTAPENDLTTFDQDQPEDFSDLSEFGNSTLSQARDGVLTFDVKISGIDSSDLRIQLREALDDKRFLWSVDNVIRSIKAGCLEVSGLNPVKTVILINRIKNLPLHIQWRQNAITQG